jgi:hypothetical protein
MGCLAAIKSQWQASLISVGSARPLQLAKAIWREANMNQQDSAASNSRPDTQEDEDRKAEVNRRASEYSRAVSEARREWAELDRITSKDSRRPAELDRSILEERLCIIEGLLQDAKERHATAKELLAAAKAIMAVYHDDFR